MPKVTVRCNAEPDCRQLRCLYALPIRTRHNQRLGINGDTPMSRLLARCARMSGNTLRLDASEECRGIVPLRTSAGAFTPHRSVDETSVHLVHVAHCEGRTRGARIWRVRSGLHGDSRCS